MLPSIDSFIRAEPWPKDALELPRIQAHRGYWYSGATENTMAAFRAAKQKGANMFECDVRLSSDLVPVVFHDPRLERIVSLKKSVEDLTAKEFQQLTGAPTLEEVLADQEIPSKINIELKSQRSLSSPIEAKVMELIRKYQAESRVLFSTFNPYYIWRLSKIAPEIPRALLVTPDLEKGNFFFVRKMWLAPVLKIHLLHLDKKMLTAERLARLKKQNVPVAVWTVNEPTEIQRYLDLGCVSVISDSLLLP